MEREEKKVLFTMKTTKVKREKIQQLLEKSKSRNDVVIIEALELYFKEKV